MDVLMIVGRHKDCDVRIGSSRVSRRHCCLAVDGDRVVVRDLSSTNGTCVNGRRIGDGQLRAGDVLSVAHLEYRLEVDEAEPDGSGTDALWRTEAAGTSDLDVAAMRRETLPEDEYVDPRDCSSGQRA